jgi:phosphoribosylanthranilate isomerase
VTVNPSVAEATALLAEGFAIVQAHFDPTKAECDPKALSAAVGPARLWLAPKLADGAEWPADLIPLAVGFVHDAHAKDAFGGTGKTSDWSRFAQLRKRYPDSQWLLAGGLGPDNIVAAAAAGADFFDLNSGIELAPGLKSAEKLSAVAEALLKNTQS